MANFAGEIRPQFQRRERGAFRSYFSRGPNFRFEQWNVLTILFYSEGADANEVMVTPIGGVILISWF